MKREIMKETRSFVNKDTQQIVKKTIERSTRIKRKKSFAKKTFQALNHGSYQT